MNNKTTAGLIIKQLNINNNNRFNNFRNKKTGKVSFIYICKTIPTRSVDCDTFSTMYFCIKTYFDYQLKIKAKFIFINYYTINSF